MPVRIIGKRELLRIISKRIRDSDSLSGPSMGLLKMYISLRGWDGDVSTNDAAPENSNEDRALEQMVRQIEKNGS